MVIIINQIRIFNNYFEAKLGFFIHTYGEGPFATVDAIKKQDITL